MLIPRIEVTSIFTGSTPADYRRQDFEYYRCNDTYYDVSVRDVNKKCEELFQMAGTFIHDGASRKSYFCSAKSHNSLSVILSFTKKIVIHSINSYCCRISTISDAFSDSDSSYYKLFTLSTAMLLVRRRS